jgi:hypothetical protein
MKRLDLVLHKLALEDESVAVSLPVTSDARQDWWTRCATQAFLRARGFADQGDEERAMQWAQYAHACERRAEDVE